MALNDFKSFVKERPSLASFVNKKEMTWQQFYDMYELYGPTNSIWNKYLGITSNSPITFNDMFNTLKRVDMTELQSGITSLQKGIGYLKDLVKDRTEDKTRTSSYEPRPMYKHFDD